MMSIEYHYTQPDRLELVLTGSAVRHYPRHIHTRSTVMGMVLQGTLELEMAGRVRLCATGARFVIPPHMPHSLTLSRGSLLATLCVDLEYTTFSAARRFSPEPRHPLFLPYRNTIREEFSNILETQSMRIAQQDATPDKNTPEKIGEMMRSIAANPAEPHSLQEMANQTGYSRWHCLRLFRKTVGVTPHVW
jgi:hypothetical protein